VESRQGPLVLGGFLHSGRTVPVHCLHELIEQGLRQAEQHLATIERALARGGQGRQQEVRALGQRRDEMGAEHATNLHPRRIILRLAGGSGGAAHLAWLSDRGYDSVVRAHDYRVAQRCTTGQRLRWEKVSKNGVSAQRGKTTRTRYPSPLRIFACRQ